ncbi:MAG: pGP6-D family virulence protein [Chlamydiae bacterium]|nr:pGP6-D family virulence protein [Chlamydiota bacterium]
MLKLNQLLKRRLKEDPSKTSKMTSLANLSSAGNLSPFSTIFQISDLNEKEKIALQSLLEQYRLEKQEIQNDLKDLIAITSEVKAIHNQAIILHGERIKKAQEILKNYQSGAFTAWLKSAYGNRQTPYNFLQYFELYISLSKTLQKKMDEMPRQAIYSLASRPVSKEKKEEIIQNYQGETKQQLLTLIREKFPLPSQDKRASKIFLKLESHFKQIQSIIQSANFQISRQQKKHLLFLMKEISTRLGKKEADGFQS